MAVALLQVEPLITSATDNNLARLLSMVVVGASVYGLSELMLWWLSGRPQGAERMALDFISRQARGSRS
jgi:hypothetical protein